MSKLKNKKSWLEKLNDADAKQEARLNARNKTAKTTSLLKSDQQLDSQIPKVSYKLLISLTLALPFVTWLMGAAINPSGWASEDPSIIFFAFSIFPVYYWIVSVPLLATIVYLLIVKRTYTAMVLVFLASLVGSIFIFTTTVNANESEFTG